MGTISRQDAIDAINAALNAYDGKTLGLTAAINALPAVDDRAAIIEECAKVAESVISADQYDTMDTDCYQDTANRIAQAIRALVNPPMPYGEAVEYLLNNPR